VNHREGWTGDSQDLLHRHFSEAKALSINTWLCSWYHRQKFSFYECSTFLRNEHCLGEIGPSKKVGQENYRIIES